MKPINEQIGVFSTICEEDAHWIDQYLAEIERLKLKYAIYLDRCSASTINRMTKHPNCVGFVRQDNPRMEYNEFAKQSIMDLIAKQFPWCLAWDMDETYEKEAPEKLKELDRIPDLFLSTHVRWVCLWNDSRHVRTDGPFADPTGSCFYRERFYWSAENWKFYSGVIYGPRPNEPPFVYPSFYMELVCLHWGYITRELREQHKKRWDHNYGKVTGKGNPYSLWDMMLDEENYPATVQEHSYL